VPKILVADDNSNIQKMVTLALKDQGIDVIGVGHGEAAVRKLPEVNPDLILADVFMPVRNGYEVCEFVKKDPRFAHIPVVLLVGAFDPRDEHEEKRVKADGVLSKPFNPVDKLMEMVKFMLARSAEAAAASAAAPAGKPMAPVGETVELTAEEMRKLTRPTQEMAVPSPAPVEETVEEPSPGPKRMEFDAGQQPVSFEGFGTPIAEIHTEEAGETEEEDEDEEEEAAPSLGESAFATAGFDELEPASAPPPPAAAEAPASSPSAYTSDEKPETPNWGGVESPAREPAPDEPPLAVSFESSSEELEIVRDEPQASQSPYVDTAPVSELASSAQEFMDSLAPSTPAEPAPAIPPPVRSSFDDTAIMEPVKPEELAAAARRAEERARQAAMEAARELNVAPVNFDAVVPEPAPAPPMEFAPAPLPAPEKPPGAVQEVAELPVSDFGMPAMAEAAAPAVIAGAAAIGYSALHAPPAEEVQTNPPAPDLSWTRTSTPPEEPEETAPEEADTSTVIAPSRLRPMLTGDTDALARPHVDEALVDAVADRVIEKVQGGILNKLTKDILRPIIEALIAQELDKRD